MKLSVDFDMEVFDGAVELDIEKVDPNATEITMDARGLNIRKIFDMKSENIKDKISLLIIISRVIILFPKNVGNKIRFVFFLESFIL